MFQPCESTFLRSGTVFQGIQQSGRSTYQVKVKFHYVDLHTSFLCGFLRIQGLSLDNPSLTTYFEAEIIGPRYSFQTRRPEWGATERSDLDHWTKFPALKQSRQGKSIKNGWDKAYRRPLEKEYVFMRWKVSPSLILSSLRSSIRFINSPIPDPPILSLTFASTQVHHPLLTIPLSPKTLPNKRNSISIQPNQTTQPPSTKPSQPPIPPKKTLKDQI